MRIGTTLLEPAVGGSVEVAYAEFASDVNISATTEATADEIVAAPATEFDGSSAYMIQFSCESLEVGTQQQCQMWLYEDGVSIGELGRFGPSLAGDTLIAPISLFRRMIPSGGSHIYSLRGSNTAATTTNFRAGAGGNAARMPGFIRITQESAGDAPLDVDVSQFLALVPEDGMLVTVAPYGWTFQYDAGETDPEKWIFISGDPYEVLEPAEWSTGIQSFQNGVPSGPTLDVPLAGRYDARVQATGVLGRNEVGRIGGFNNGVQFSQVDGPPNSNPWPASTYGTTVEETFARNALFREMYRTTSGAGDPAYFDERTINITPVAVSQA